MGFNIRGWVRCAFGQLWLKGTQYMLSVASAFEEAKPVYYRGLNYYQDHLEVHFRYHRP